MNLPPQSLVMHNPPAEKVGHFFRGKLKWEAKKDRILRSCMSSKWMKAKEATVEFREMTAAEDDVVDEAAHFNPAMTPTTKGRVVKNREKIRREKSRRMTGKPINPKSLMKQFSLQNLKGNRMQF